jgi:hypothetical protein
VVGGSRGGEDLLATNDDLHVLILKNSGSCFSDPTARFGDQIDAARSRLTAVALNPKVSA